MDNLEFTSESFNEFKKIYKDCQDKSIESFMFQNKQVLTSYAKYVIEYVESKNIKI